MIIRESLAWLDTHVKGKRERLHEMPVQLFVMGANTWRHFADWPPPVRSERWYLQANGGLAPTMPLTSQPDRYRYDPADPTPAVGGNSLGAAKHMGPKDNRSLEARPDVLVYTSAVLEQDMEVIGPVTAELYVHSSLEHTDFFARLCVVEASGKSINLCDGILRLTPGSIPPEPDGSLHICDPGLANRLPLPQGTAHARPGLQRRSPALRAQSRQRRTTGDGNEAVCCRPDRLSRPRTPFGSSAAGAQRIVGDDS